MKSGLRKRVDDNVNSKEEERRRRRVGRRRVLVRARERRERLHRRRKDPTEKLQHLRRLLQIRFLLALLIRLGRTSLRFLQVLQRMGELQAMPHEVHPRRRPLLQLLLVMALQSRQTTLTRLVVQRSSGLQLRQVLLFPQLALDSLRIPPLSDLLAPEKYKSGHAFHLYPLPSSQTTPLSPPHLPPHRTHHLP